MVEKKGGGVASVALLEGEACVGSIVKFAKSGAPSQKAKDCGVDGACVQILDQALDQYRAAFPKTEFKVISIRLEPDRGKTWELEVDYPKKGEDRVFLPAWALVLV